MLAPLYEAVYDRMEIGSRHPDAVPRLRFGPRDARRGGPGAHVTGVDSDRERLALARARLLPDAGWDDAPAHSPHPARRRARLVAEGVPRRSALTVLRTT